MENLGWKYRVRAGIIHSHAKHQRALALLLLAAGCRRCHVGAFLGGEEGEELAFDDAWIVTGLDGENSLHDDLFVKKFFLGANGEFIEERAANHIGPERAVECAQERDL